MLTFEIPGDPVAKARPRASMVAGRARLYTPAKTEKYEARVALFAQQAMAGRPVIEGPVALSVTALFPIPASWPKKRQAAARAAAPAQPRASRPATASKAEPQPLPCRVVGAELRAGERSVSVAPANGDFTPDQLQVLLPGDAVGPWRLQAVEGNTAVFQAGDQTRRVAIP